MQIITLKKSSIVRNSVFILILAASLAAFLISSRNPLPTSEIKLYFVDAEMTRLIPVKTVIPKLSTQKTAQRALDMLIEGHDSNPKIRRLIPKIKRGMTVKVKDKIAYVDIKKAVADGHPDGRDLEKLTVYSVVNSLTEIDGISSVRFTIDGKTEKKFKGYLDMRETFTADYFV